MEHAGYVLNRPSRTRRVAPLAVPAYRVPVRRRPRRRTSGLPAPARLVFTLACLGATLLVIVGAFVHFAYQGRVLPGVHAGVLELGGLTEAEAKGVLDVAANPLLSAPAVFAYGAREWRPTANEMGLGVDTAAMAREAAQAGRGGLF